jgi:protein TonB
MNPEIHVHPTVMEIVAAEAGRDGRLTRWALGVALAVHATVFAVHWPVLVDGVPEARHERRLYPVMTDVRIQPPPPAPPSPRVRSPEPGIPVPARRPDDSVPVAVIMPRTHAADRGLPELPPAPPAVPAPPPAVAATAPVRWTPEMTEPVRVHAPAPRYTEAARLARLQGVVVLECVIDREGRIASIRVLRPLRLGLTEAAVAAVRQWRFVPATAEGRPLDVIYTLTVRFTVQGG